MWNQGAFSSNSGLVTCIQEIGDAAVVHDEMSFINENSQALGDYTKNINDFTVFPVEDKDGRSGQYWYHEDTQYWNSIR
ncbi:hypothetical protein Tco_0331741 [Tanacetum coccineum]